MRWDGVFGVEAAERYVLAGCTGPPYMCLEPPSRAVRPSCTPHHTAVRVDGMTCSSAGGRSPRCAVCTTPHPTPHMLANAPACVTPHPPSVRLAPPWSPSPPGDPLVQVCRGTSPPVTTLPRASTAPLDSLALRARRAWTSLPCRPWRPSALARWVGGPPVLQRGGGGREVPKRQAAALGACF